MPNQSQYKENDPSYSRLKRLSSITAIATPIGQIALKFRRPSTAMPTMVLPEEPGTGQRKTSFFKPRGSRQISNNSAKGQLQSPPTTPLLLEKPLPAWVPRPNESRLSKSQTMSNLPILMRREASYQALTGSQSSTNLMRKSTIPTPVDGKSPSDLRAPRQASFRASRKTSGSALPRFSTQPDLISTSHSTAIRPRFKESLSGVEEVIENKRDGFILPRKQNITPVGRNTSTKLGVSYDRSKEIRRPHTAIQPPMWEQMTPSKPPTTFRKSIENEYEEIQLTPDTLTRKRAELDLSPRCSLGGDIKVRQLMAPLSPPLPRPPAGYTDAPTPISLASARFVRQVTQAQSPAYWSGRYTSLNDRLLNEAMEACPTSINPFSSDLSKEEIELLRLAGAAHSEAHAQRILDLLYAACMTEEALRSLRMWQTTFGHLRQMPNLTTYTPTTAFSNLVAQARTKKRESVVLSTTPGNSQHSGLYSAGQREKYKSENSLAGSDLSAVTATRDVRDVSIEYMPGGGSGRKTGFMDRLLNGGRRISGKASVLALHGGVGDREGLIAR